MSPSRALAALLPLLAVACTPDPARRVAEEALAAQLAVPLPAVSASQPRVTRPRLRVLVGPRTIDVDDAGLFASWPEPRRARLLRELGPDEAASLPFFHAGLARIDGGRIAPPHTPAPGLHDLPELRHVLDFAHRVERRYEDIAREEHDVEPELDASSKASVYVAADVPFGVVVPVLHTVSQTMYTPVIVARGPEGDVELGFDTPRIGGRPAVIRIIVGTEGAFVTIEAGLALAREPSPVLVPEPGPRAASRLGRPVLPPDRACPPAPLRDGSIDRARLTALLRAIARHAPEDTVALLVPLPEMRWGAVVEMGSAAIEAGIPRFLLGIQRSGEAPPDCRQGIGVDEISPDDLLSGRR